MPGLCDAMLAMPTRASSTWATASSRSVDTLSKARSGLMVLPLAAAMATLSAMLMSRRGLTSCCDKDMPRWMRWWIGSPLSDSPASDTLPSVGCTTPMMERIIVVLPAPLGPISPSRSPS
ncbi:hypothetical protein D9M68_740070 [compost metagenome]